MYVRKAVYIIVYIIIKVSKRLLKLKVIKYIYLWVNLLGRDRGLSTHLVCTKGELYA